MPGDRNETQFARYREWQWIKHLILADYLRPWAAKVGKTSGRIYVVDAFAGAGTYDDAVTGEKTDGSPVIASIRAKEYAGERPWGSMHLICVEKNRHNFDALSRRLSGFGDLVTLHHGAFAAHVDDIAEEIANAPALVLLDPIGVKAIDAKTCKRLLGRAGKTDVFVIVQFQVVHRSGGQLLATGHANPALATAEQNAANIDAFFDGHRWRMIAVDPDLSSSEKEDRYLDLYFEDVLGRRYDFKSAYAVRRRIDAPPKYWLVHASDHFDALMLMNDEIVKVDEQLYIRSWGPNAIPELVEAENERRKQAVFSELRGATLKTLRAAPQHAMTFGDLRDELIGAFFGRVKSGAYSKAAKELVREDKVLREERKGAKVQANETFMLPDSPLATSKEAASR